MIVRESRRERFTVVSNAALEDSRLSFQAKGLLVYLLSKPDGWSVSREHLATVGTNGISSVRAILTELEQCGYLTRVRKAGEHGHFAWESIIHENPAPSAENPPMVNPPMEKPPVVNRTLVNTDSKKTELVKTEAEIPPTPTGGDEQGVDAFTPEELYSEPLPASLSRSQRQKEQASKNEKRTAIIAAFRHAKYGKPFTDPIAPAEFDKCKSAADDLIAAGATPEVVIAATNRALEEWTESARVTLRAVAGNLTELTTTLPQRARTASQYTQRERVAALEVQTVQRLQGDTSDPLALMEARERAQAQRNAPVRVRIAP